MHVANTSSSPLAKHLRTWKALRGTPGDREEQFRQALDVPVDDDEPSLWGLAIELVEAGRFKDAAEVCVDALRGPVEYRDHWSGLAVYALARAKRFSEVRAQVPEAFFCASLGGAEHLMCGLILLLEHDERDEDAKAVYHGAARVVVSFASTAKALGIERKRYGRSRPALIERFSEILTELLEDAAIEDGMRSQAESNLREVGCAALADRIANTSDVAGTDKRPEPKVVMTKPPGEATDRDFDEALRALPSLDEVQRHELLAWVYGAVGENRQRGHAIDSALVTLPPPTDVELREDWLSSLNNAAVMTWKRKDYELSRALIEAAQPYAHEYPAIFHAAACTFVSLGELDKAFDQVKLAVKHRYDELSELKRDPDLGELRAWPSFKDLFARRKR